MNEFIQYAKDLRRAADSLEQRAERLVAEVGQEVLRDARARAPRDTGRLAASLRVERKGTQVEVTSSAPYAQFQEYGTSQVPPQPFIGPAAARGADRLVKGLEDLADDLGGGS